MFKLMYLCNNRFDVSHRGVQQELYKTRGGFESKIVYFDPCIRILVVRTVQKMLLILIHLETFFGTNRLDVFCQNLNRKL